MNMPSSFREAITKAATVTVNVGKRDRQARVLAGLGLIFLSYKEALPGWAAIFGVILMVTAGLRYCPLYSMVDQNTCDSDAAKN
jgi:hypothetical protein